MVNQEQKQYILSNILLQYENRLFYTAPFDQQIWKATPMPGIDRERLFRELNANGKTLYEQAETNAGNIRYYFPNLKEDEEQRLLNYHHITRDRLYPMFYNQ